MLIDKRFLLHIGLMAHNEEENIGRLLKKLIKLASDDDIDVNITVVASGCTDRTEEIVRSFAENYSCVKLINENQRKGKACAINLFLKQARGDILIISSADIIPSDNALSVFMRAFSDLSVGMVGGRPLPNPSGGLVGRLNELLWELHHEVALSRPKLGEFVAIRNIVDVIPDDTAADEASLEAVVTQKGYFIKYLPEVLIYNNAPKDIRTFVKVRTRVFMGHIFVKQRMFYRVSTYQFIPLAYLMVKKICLERRKIFIALLLACLEVYARGAAVFNFCVKKQTNAVWTR